MSSGSLPSGLASELDQWSARGQTARLWWRDDDAAAETPALTRLLGLARSLDLATALAVIPAKVQRSLVERLHGTKLSVWQHGFSHDFHVAGEFGEGRPLDDLRRDAVRGQILLDEAFGPAGWQRVFVPPNHMLSVPFKGLLPGLGYHGVSAGVPRTPVLPHVAELNADIDVMDWPAGRLLDVARIAAMMAGELAARRTGARFVEPLGILTHHLAFDEPAWRGVSDILTELRAHSNVSFLSPADLFPGHDADDSALSQVSVVITSCGRPDLLERTLSSFFLHCEYPVFEVLIMEDGERPSPLAGSTRFDRHPIRWLCTGARRGQVRAADLAYGLVSSPYIFHCEDDWEFYAPGFLEKSLAVLEQDTRVLLVWLRALDDTNTHPVDGDVRHAAHVPYRLMARGFESAEWGTWHGFSWNPGLRRRRDYLLLGSFGRFLDAGIKTAWEVERAVSASYADHGLSAAILADNDGRGYVRHIGWGRRVGDPD